MSHFLKLSTFENSRAKKIENATVEKEYLEGQKSKLLDFRSATTKVKGLPDGAFDAVWKVIEQLTTDIEFRQDLITKYTEETKQEILKYFKRHLTNVELSQELKDMATKYGFTPDPQSSACATEVFQIEQKYAEYLKGVQKRKLSNMKPPIVEILQRYGVTLAGLKKTSNARSSKRAATGQLDSSVNNGPKKSRNHQQVLLAIKDAYLTKSQHLLAIQQHILSHIEKLKTKRNLILCYTVPNMDKQLEDIDQKLNSYKVQLHVANEKLEFARENLKSKMEDFVAQMVDDQNIFQHTLQLFETTQTDVQTFAHPTSVDDEPSPLAVNAPGSMPAESRGAQIKNDLEMIDYVRKSITSDQLTEEILHLLDDNSTTSKAFSNAVPDTLRQQIKKLYTLNAIANSFNEVRLEVMKDIEEGRDSIDQELVRLNSDNVREIGESVTGERMVLEETLEKIKAERRIFAVMFLAPEQAARFILPSNIPTLLVEMIDAFEDPKCSAKKKSLEERLQQLTENLENEYDQVVTSIKSSSTTHNVGREDNEFAEQSVETKNANAAANQDDADRQA